MGDMARFLASIGSAPHDRSNNVFVKMQCMTLIQFDFTGSVRNRSLEAIKGGSSIAEREVC
jgi:hypothetical protein